MALANTPATAAEPTAQEAYEINTQLMETTFLVVGPSSKEAGKTTGGTVFVMAKNERGAYVIVTAAHVLEDIAGDVATMLFRTKGADGKYVIADHHFAIRDKGKALFAKHPEVDVAVLYIKMPKSFQSVKMLQVGLFASDEWLTRFEIHPGDELLCLGFPLFATSDYGFPILRGGKIASYPLVPSKEHKNWLLDFRIFKGNSGGPVYFTDRNRMYGGVTHQGETIQFLVGLVTALRTAPLVDNRELQIGVIIPGIYIKETLDMLPAVSPYE